MSEVHASNAIKIVAACADFMRASGLNHSKNEVNLPVPSPCISVCLMDSARQLCDGCFRTIDEIAAWSRMDDLGKRVVWHRIAQRASAVVASDPSSVTGMTSGTRA
jgi:predicted Fe-S protein YdhL (DUF1289 family)